MRRKILRKMKTSWRRQIILAVAVVITDINLFFGFFAEILWFLLHGVILISLIHGRLFTLHWRLFSLVISVVSRNWCWWLGSQSDGFERQLRTGLGRMLGSGKMFIELGEWEEHTELRRNKRSRSGGWRGLVTWQLLLLDRFTGQI